MALADAPMPNYGSISECHVVGLKGSRSSTSQGHTLGATSNRTCGGRVSRSVTKCDRVLGRPSFLCIGPIFTAPPASRTIFTNNRNTILYYNLLKQRSESGISCFPDQILQTPIQHNSRKIPKVCKGYLKE